MRVVATSKDVAHASTPMKDLPKSTAACPVVPVPMNGSTTRSPLRVLSSMNVAASS